MTLNVKISLLFLFYLLMGLVSPTLAFSLQLTVTKTGTGTGTVSSAAASINCGSTCTSSVNLNDTVTLTASPAPSSTFTGWSGACSGSTNTCTVPMTQAQSVSAGFAKRVINTTTFEYDPKGNLTQVTDPLGHVRQFQFNGLDQLVHELEPDPATPGKTAGKIDTAYDPLGQVTRITDPRNLNTDYQVDSLGNTLTQTSPDTGKSQNTHDSAGNLLTTLDARGQKISYSYDALNRVTKIQYGNGQTINLTYDQGNNGRGHLTQSTDDFSTTRWSYDARGRVISKTLSIAKVNLLTRYSYDASGQLSSITYPSGKSVQFANNQGLLTALNSDSATLIKDIHYQPFGAPDSWTYGNGIKTSRSFDLNGRLIGYDLGDRNRELTYDAAGRIINYKDSDLNYDQHFNYDGLSRLTGFASSNSQSVLDYDLNGNRTQLNQDGKTITSNLDSNSNRILGVNSLPAKNYRYDSAGNIINDGRTQFIYDGRGRLVQANGSFGQEQYRINGLGQRIAKISGNDLSGDANQDGTITSTDLRLIVLMVKGSQPVNLAADCNHDGKITNADATCAQAKMADMRVNPSEYLQAATYFVYDEAGHLLGEYNQTGTAIQETVWLADMPVAVLTGGNVGYIYMDHLNSPRAIADQTGKVVWRWDADAFGTTSANEDPDKDGKVFTYNLRFPGQYFDKSTGLHYNGFRDYDPGTGRYMQSDPIGLLGGINTYGYVNSSPLIFFDEYGLDRWGAEGGLGIVYTQMKLGQTIYYDSFTGESFIFTTSNKVAKNSKLGADNPYSGLVTYCERGQLKKAYGTAKMRTTDSRYRWIHGGGSGLIDPWSPQQGWKPTEGCTRAQNEDVDHLCTEIDVFRIRYPKGILLYRRD